MGFFGWCTSNCIVFISIWTVIQGFSSSMYAYRVVFELDIEGWAALIDFGYMQEGQSQWHAGQDGSRGHKSRVPTVYKE